MFKTLVFFLSLIFVYPLASAAPQLDLEASKLEWLGKKIIGDKNHTGTLAIKSAELKGTKEQLTGATLVFDMKSINVTDLTGKWKGKLEDHLKSEDFFEVNTYPEASLKLTEIGKSKAKGLLKIKNEEKEVNFEFQRKGDTYTGLAKINRTDYGVIYGSKNFFKKLAVDKVIDDMFTVKFELKVKEAAAAQPKKSAKKS